MKTPTNFAIGLTAFVLASMPTLDAVAEILPLQSAQGGINNFDELIFTNNTISANFFGSTFEDGAQTVNATRDPGTQVTQSNVGLGTSTAGDYNSTIDGFNANEILIAQLATPATLTEIAFTRIDFNDSFDFFVDTNNDGILERVLSNVNIAANALSVDQLSFAFSIADLFEGASALFGFGASGTFDNFKISGLNFASVSEVPIPGALPLFTTGLLGFQLSRRRRKHQ